MKTSKSQPKLKVSRRFRAKGLALKRGADILLLLTLGAGVAGCAIGGSASWNEELLLHDGSKMIVEQTQAYGGYPTLESTERAVLSERWEFRAPSAAQKIVWESDFHRPPEGNSLMLMRLDFLNGVPYIATSPAGCLAYNFWKRPNPPYVFFKYDGKAWQQVSLADFPEEFKEANVVVGGRMNPQKQAGTTLSINDVKYDNHSLAPYLRGVLREPLAQSQLCPPELTGSKAPYPIRPKGLDASSK